MPKTNEHKRSWIVRADCFSPRDFVEFLRDLELPQEPQDSPVPNSITVSFSGSPTSDKIAPGTVDKSLAQLSMLESEEFVTANAQLTYANNMKGSIECDFVVGQVTIAIIALDPNQSPDFLFGPARSAFPSRAPLGSEEIQELTKRLQDLVSEAKAISSRASDMATIHDNCIEQQLEIENTLESVVKTLGLIDGRKDESTSVINEISEHRKTAVSVAAEIGNIKAQVEADKKTVQEGRDGVGAMESSIQLFFDAIEANNSELESISARSDDVVKANERLQDEIKQHLQRAVGASLFGAFENRKLQIVKAKWVWAVFTLLSLLLQAGILIWLAMDFQKLVDAPNVSLYTNPAFILKVTVSLPIVALIAFCIRQYSHERSHEEAYAFKSTLSLSLSPYIDLVERLADDGSQKEHTEFVVETIRQVFDAPTGQSKNEKTKAEPTEAAMSLAKQIVDLIKKNQ